MEDLWEKLEIFWLNIWEIEAREAEVNLVATNVLARNAVLDEKLAVMMKEFTAMKE